MAVERRESPHTSSRPPALCDVVDFLRAHPPFDALELALVESAAASAEVEFFLAGSAIFAQSTEPIEHLRVVSTGAVELVSQDRVLPLLGPGVPFGEPSLVSGLPNGAAARAREDTLCYRIPEEIARAVLARPHAEQHHRASQHARGTGASTYKHARLPRGRTPWLGARAIARSTAAHLARRARQSSRPTLAPPPRRPR